MTEGTGTGGEIVPAAVITPAGDGHGLSAGARAAVSAGMPENTRIAYERDWRAFTEWCQENGRNPLPASADTLTEYVTYLCYERPVTDRRGNIIPGKTGLSPSSVSRARWAVIKAHELAEVEPPHGKRTLQVIKGYETKLAEARDSRAKPSRASAATPEVIRELTTTGLKGNQELIAVRDRAMFLLAYSAATRGSELVAINIGDVEETDRGLLVSVYRHKTRKHEAVAIPSAGAPEAVKAVTEWIALLKEHGRTEGPLFPRIDKHGNIGAASFGGRGGTGEPTGAPDGRMGKEAAWQRVKLAADAAGLEGKWTVHSTRSGFATQARFSGADALDIARHGGWADNSTVLTRYMRDADKWSRNPLNGAGI